MTLGALLRRLFPDRRATAAVEFAIVVPVLLALMSGTVEFGRAFQVYSATNRLASRYAIAWADCSDYPAGNCATEMAMYTTAAAVKNFAPQLVNATALRMFQITMSGSTASITYAYPAGATLTAAELSTAQAAIANNQVGVVVTVTYVHTLVFFQQLMAPFLGTSRTITATIAQLKS